MNIMRIRILQEYINIFLIFQIAKIIGSKFFNQYSPSTIFLEFIINRLFILLVDDFLYFASFLIFGYGISQALKYQNSNTSNYTKMYFISTLICQRQNFSLSEGKYT